MEQVYRLALAFEPQPEGGYTVTCPSVPGLITEGDTISEALENARDALKALIEAHEEFNQPLPEALSLPADASFVCDCLLPVA